jgi:hypothetical protein
MITDFDNMIAELNGQIAVEEDRTKIKDTGHPAYSTFAMAAAKRCQNRAAYTWTEDVLFDHCVGACEQRNLLLGAWKRLMRRSGRRQPDAR